MPRFKFPKKFSLSYNETHYSNEKEACKFIEEILQPYIKKVIELENLPVDQKSLVIMDVFTGQVKPIVLNLYKGCNIVVVLVPANMTNFLQPLTLSSSVESLMRDILYVLEINWMRESSYKISMFQFVYRF